MTFSLLDCCGGILANSSLQSFFSSLKFVGILRPLKAPLQCFSRVEFWTLDHYNTLVGSSSAVLCAWGHCLAAGPKSGQVLAVRQMASHLIWNTLAYRGVHGHLSECLVPRSCGCTTMSTLHRHHTWQSVRGVAVFGFHQTWTNISTLVSTVHRTLSQKSCSLCTYAVLPWAFNRKGDFF